MRKFFWKGSLYKTFIFSFGIVIFLPILIIGIFSYYRSAEQLNRQTESYTKQIVLDLSDNLDEIVQDYDALTLRLVSVEEVVQFVKQDRENYAKKWEFQNWIERYFVSDILKQKPFIQGYHIIGEKSVTYSTDGEKAVSRLEHLKTSLPADGSLKLFLNVLPEDNQQPSSSFITLGRAILSKGNLQPIGAIFLDIRTDKIKKIWRMNETWKNTGINSGYVWIIDERERVVYHPNTKILGTRADMMVRPQFPAGNEGNIICKLDGKEQLLVYKKSEYTGWKVVVTIPIHQLRLPINNLRSTIVYSSIVAFLLAMLVGYFFIAAILQPVRKLQQAMKGIGDAKWEKLSGNLPDNEIGLLMQDYNTMVKKIADLIDEIYKAELNLKLEELVKQKSELQALQTQINPHFLYNTLGVINAYAIVDEKEAIQEIVDALGSMFRYAVESPFEPVRLQDEINHVENYLTIQRHRQSMMPKVEWNVSKYINCPMLRLSLQPIFENIFNHAFINGIEEHHKIWVDIREEKDMFIVEVKDNGIGPTWDVPEIELLPEQIESKSKRRSGIGLANVNRRLQITYGESYGLRISGIKDIGMTVKILMPSIGSTSGGA